MSGAVDRQALHSVLAQRYGEETAVRLENSSAAVCGLGGLGSNIAIDLARGGVGKLILIDFDVVDISNLHRQQYKAAQVGMLKTEAMAENIREIMPYTQIVTYNVKLTEENICKYVADADVVCEAFDEADSKAMLINTVCEKLPEKYIISSSGMAGFGDGNDIKTRRITERFYLCGDGKSDVESEKTLVSARVSLCAAHEALAALKLLAGKI